VVGHDVDEQLESAGVRLDQQLVEVGQVPKLGSTSR
jgi:hypothetical protein